MLGMLYACSSDNDFEKAKKQLESQGYTEVINTGWDIFCCGRDDTFSTGFVALSKDSTEVRGCICSSVLKGITIRFK